MLKKIISALLTAVMLAAVAVPANAAVADEEALGASHKYTHVGNYKQSNAQLVFYTYNVNSDARSFFVLENVTKNTTERYKFAEYFNHPGSIKIIPSDTYDLGCGVSFGSSGGYGGGYKTEFENTGGAYEKIRVKLSDYSDYFNSNGTHTQGSHTYTFCEEPADSLGDRYTSLLVFISGGAINCVVPDSKGEVEIVVSKRIGARTFYMTDFHYIITSKGCMTTGGGGGKSNASFPGLTIGDANLSGYVDVSDATNTQMKLADLVKYDSLQTRNADANGDGKIDISDVTYIQMFCADLI